MSEMEESAKASVAASRGALEFEQTPDRATRDRLIRARIAMLMDAPFFGQIAMRLRLLEVAEKSGGLIPTAATNGRDLFYNKQFVNKLTDGELKFVMGHEVYHCVWDHTNPGRVNGRIPLLWNIAADYVINLMLSDEKIGTMPEKCLYDVKYRNMSTEQVYDDLLKNAPRMSWEEMAKQLLDRHLQGAPENSEGGGGTIIVEDNGSGSNQAGCTPEEKSLAEELRQAVISAAESAAKQGGKIPGSVSRMISDWLEPKIDWRTMLQAEIASLVRNDYTFMRPSRRNAAMDGIFLPGNDTEKRLEIAIGIDMSGSIGMEEARVFLSEVRGIVEMYNSFKIDVWTYDHIVHEESHTVITEDGPDTLDDFVTRMKGGGGTSYEANYEYMMEHDLRPKQFINFTDGYPNNTWGDPDYTNTVFIIYGSRNKPPFGAFAFYEDAT